MKKRNGTDMKMGEFKGEVLTHLQYIKETQDKQCKDIEHIKETLVKNGKVIAVLKYVTGVLGTWLAAMTGFIIKYVKP